MGNLYFIFLFVTCFTGFSQNLNLPARPASALSGSQFAASISSSTLTLTSRENLIYTQVSGGNIPDFYRTLAPVTSTATINSVVQSVTYYVIPDYLAIGCDTDYFLCPMSPMLATRIGNLTSTTLPTRKMVNDIWSAATVHMSPQPLSAGSQMSTVPYFIHHDSLVDSARQTFIPPHSLGELTSGDKKDVVISNLIYSTANRVVIYGWHYTSGSPIQPMTNVHSDTYMDYSHGIRLVQNACVLNGNTPTTIQTVLQSSTLNSILSDEGVISQPWYPYYVGTINVPQSFALLGNSSTSLKLIVKNDPAATHYNIYKSTNGTSFGTATKFPKNNLIISGLNNNQVYFVKISAYDSINNLTSAVSEVLAAVPCPQTDSILIVNAFDRAVAGNTYDFVKQHGFSIVNYGKKIESCTNEAATDNLLQLSNYRIVDWILGEESSVNETFSTTEQNYVSAYLQQGGKFFTSGSEIGWDIDHLGSISDKQFYNNFLKAAYVMDSPNNTAGSCYAGLVQPLNYSILVGLGDTAKFDNGTYGTYNVNYPDVISPMNGSLADLRYTSTSADIACVHYDGMFSAGTKSGKMVYMAFPFETIYTPAQRDTVMKDILNFFYGTSNLTAGINSSEKLTCVIYPNPSSGVVNIIIVPGQLLQGTVNAELLDVSGRTVSEQFFTSSSSCVFDAGNVENGMYVMQIICNGKKYSQRIIISR